MPLSFPLPATSAAAAASLAATCALMLTPSPTSAQVVNVISNDTSQVASGFDHQTVAGPVTFDGTVATFTHHTRLNNHAVFNGGVAQTHGRRSSFVVSFTVLDPGNIGFALDVDQLLRGYSEVVAEAGRGDATGVSYYVQIDDSTDAPNTLTAEPNLFIGTSGVHATGGPTTTVREYDEATESTSLGSFVGTTDFLFDYTTNFTPTTNVFFQNNAVGGGEIAYGFGTPRSGDSFQPEQLGHIADFIVTYNAPVPEPAALALLGMSPLVLRRRR